METVLALIGIFAALIAVVKNFKLQAQVNKFKNDLDYAEVQNKQVKEDLVTKKNLLGKLIIKAASGRKVTQEEIDYEK